MQASIGTSSGPVLYFSYAGVLERNAKVQAANASGGETQFEDQYFRITPRLECGDERYSWVNQTIFVGRGRIVPGGVAYEVFRVT